MVKYYARTSKDFLKNWDEYTNVPTKTYFIIVIFLLVCR